MIDQEKKLIEQADIDIQFKYDLAFKEEECEVRISELKDKHKIERAELKDRHKYLLAKPVPVTKIEDKQTQKEIAGLKER